MTQKFRRNLQFGYGIAITMLFCLGIIAYVTINKLLASDRLVTHSQVVMEKLEKALSFMKDAETGQRGYLLTGNRMYLEPYNGSVQRALALIGEVKTLTVNDDQQQANIENIRQILTKRMVRMKELVDKKAGGGVIIETDLTIGKKDMDALRSAVAKAEQQEQLLLDKRIQVLGQYAVYTPPFIGLIMLIAAGVTAGSYFRAIRDFNQKDGLNHELAKKEQETALINEELAAANEEINAANEELTSLNEELLSSQEELENANHSLEDKVAERTRSLLEATEEAQALNEELTATNEELLAARDLAEKNEKLFHSIAVNIPDSLIVVIDPEQRVLALEGTSTLLNDFQNKNVQGQPLTEIVQATYFKDTAEFTRVLGGEQFRLERKDSDGRDLQLDFVPLRNEDGDVYAAMIIVLDISGIKKADERSAKLAAIVESSDDAIVSKTVDGIVTSWNKGAERMFGYTEEQMLGVSILKIIPKARYDEETYILTQIRSGQIIEHFETERLTASGKLLNVSLTVSPLRDTSGNIIGVSKIARDITEQKRDEQRKNDFIAMVSHELKTPLTTLSALLQVLNQKLAVNGDKFLSSAADKANIQIRKMTVMINGFLNLSRLESGKIVIERQHFNLAELIKEMIAEMELTITTHTFHFTCNNHLPVDADRDKIGSVVTNLLSNAVKYSPKGKNIVVDCGILPGEVRISVADEGIGISEQDMNKLFQRYYRASDPKTMHISGFGIGLYLSAEIVQRHGGKIWAESAPNAGSVFYFTLPLDKSV